MFVCLFITDVNFYQVKMLMFYNVQTINSTFIDKHRELRCTVNSYSVARDFKSYVTVRYLVCFVYFLDTV